MIDAAPSPSPTRNLPRWVWLLLLGASACLFAYTCYRAAYVAMTFDEVWSLNSYASAPWGQLLSFQPVSANNHIGNSVLMKLCLSAFGNSAFSLRLPNLIAHLFFLAYSIALARRFRQGVWVLLAFFLLNFHPFVLDFFSLARGYGLAMGMVMGALYHLYALRENAFSRHIISNVIFAGLSVLFNLSFLHFFVANACVLVLLIYSHSHAWNVNPRIAVLDMAKRLSPLLIVTIGLYLLLRAPVKALIAANELYYGGETGFWTDTVTSLAHAMLYKIDYWQHDLEILLQWGILSLVAMFLAFGVEWSEREHRLRASPGALAFLMLLVVAVTCTVQHFWVGSPFLIYRTALFLIPIYMLALVWLLRTVAKVAEFRKPVIALSVAIALALGLHSVRALNTTHCAEWICDADTKQMLQDLAADRGTTQPTTLGLSWQLRAVTKYYRMQMNWVTLAEPSNNGCQPGMDYYFVLGDGEGCKLPGDQLPFGKPQGCTMIKHYPISNTTLWRAN